MSLMWSDLRPLYLLGYIPQHNRVYLADKEMNVFSYALALSLVEYQTAVLRGDMDAAEEILPNIPKEQRSKVASFLEGRGMFMPNIKDCPKNSL
jgi:coatomer subunit beta'